MLIHTIDIILSIIFELISKVVFCSLGLGRSLRFLGSTVLLGIFPLESLVISVSCGFWVGIFSHLLFSNNGVNHLQSQEAASCKQVASKAHGK